MDILRSGRRSLRHTNSGHPVRTLRSGDLACPGVGMQLLFPADMPALVASAGRRPGRGATTLDEEQEVAKCDIVVGARSGELVHRARVWIFCGWGVKTFADGTLAQRPFQALHPRPASPASVPWRATCRGHTARTWLGSFPAAGALSMRLRLRTAATHHNLAIPGACPPLGQAPRQNASSARLATSFERHRTQSVLPRCVARRSSCGRPIHPRPRHAPRPSVTAAEVLRRDKIRPERGPVVDRRNATPRSRAQRDHGPWEGVSATPQRACDVGRMLVNWPAAAATGDAA